MQINFDDTIKSVAPDLRVVAIEADVCNGPTPDGLWALIERCISDIRMVTEMPDINRRPAIKATRRIYKTLGKDPNRYRPSAEALCRRAVKGLELYRINTLVDLINLVSLQSGYSIGGFDRDKIDGNELILGVGRVGEEFEGIGRGLLNIEHLPIYRDRTGGIGTPTSDNERTKLDETSRRLLVCINIYEEEMSVDDTVDLTLRLLESYAAAQNVTVKIFRP